LLFDEDLEQLKFDYMFLIFGVWWCWQSCCRGKTTQ